MDREPQTISSATRIAELAEQIAKHDPAVTRHQGLLVVDADGSLEGIITRSDILRSLEQDPAGSMTVLEAGRRDVVVTYPNEMLHEASAKMLRHKIGRLPVVDRGNPRKIVGYIGRQGIMEARVRRLEEEHVREIGWLGGWRRRAGT